MSVVCTGCLEITELLKYAKASAFSLPFLLKMLFLFLNVLTEKSHRKNLRRTSIQKSPDAVNYFLLIYT